MFKIKVSAPKLLGADGKERPYMRKLKTAGGIVKLERKLSDDGKIEADKMEIEVTAEVLRGMLARNYQIEPANKAARDCLTRVEREMQEAAEKAAEAAAALPGATPAVEPAPIVEPAPGSAADGGGE